MAPQPAWAACRSVRWSPTRTLRERSRARVSAAPAQHPRLGLAAVAAGAGVVETVQHGGDVPAGPDGAHHLPVDLLQAGAERCPWAIPAWLVTTTTG